MFISILSFAVISRSHALIVLIVSLICNLFKSKINPIKNWSGENSGRLVQFEISVDLFDQVHCQCHSRRHLVGGSVEFIFFIPYKNCLNVNVIR
jgi:hypothetical protein